MPQSVLELICRPWPQRSACLYLLSAKSKCVHHYHHQVRHKHIFTPCLLSNWNQKKSSMSSVPLRLGLVVHAFKSQHLGQFIASQSYKVKTCLKAGRLTILQFSMASLWPTKWVICSLSPQTLDRILISHSLLSSEYPAHKRKLQSRLCPQRLHLF